jgi:SWI/SNF-related matrix-associated actin-dependent regulator of chromatin subfamily A-like protein 1
MKSKKSAFVNHATVFHEIPINVMNLFYDTKKSTLKLIDNASSNHTSELYTSLEEVSFDLSLVDRKLRESLLPFQLAGVQFALEKSGRVLLADDMGLGKTIQAIAVAAFYRREWPCLVVTPASLVVSWQIAFLEWLPSLTSDLVSIIYSGTVKKCLDSTSTFHLIYILSYDMAVRCASWIKEKKFRVIIADESHYLKNPNSKRSKTLIPIFKVMSRF